MIGILNAYHFDPTPGNYQDEYTRLIQGFAKQVFPDKTVHNYDIALGVWPDSIEECEVWIITGSAKAAYDQDEWIQRLKKFIVELHQNKKKLIGICFGHQIIAEALGGQVIKSPKGWGVGVKDFRIIQSQPWMTPPLQQVSLLFSHQDQVVKLPKDAKLLAENAFCEFQMYQIGDHILSLQGHPEFSVDFARERLESRKDRVPQDIFQSAIRSLEKPKDVETLEQWLRNFCS